MGKSMGKGDIPPVTKTVQGDCFFNSDVGSWLFAQATGIIAAAELDVKYCVKTRGKFNI